ncbi:hypothetical protein ACEA41_22035, partial [Escherichia coli]
VWFSCSLSHLFCVVVRISPLIRWPNLLCHYKLEFLQKLAMSDTDRVAEVLRQWITSNERIDNK